MFKDLEKKARKELIKLYQDYIKNPNNPELEKRGMDCEQKYGAVKVLSKEIAYAGWKASELALKELPIKEAKEILKSLD